MTAEDKRKSFSSLVHVKSKKTTFTYCRVNILLIYAYLNVVRHGKAHSISFLLTILLDNPSCIEFVYWRKNFWPIYRPSKKIILKISWPWHVHLGLRQATQKLHLRIRKRISSRIECLLLNLLGRCSMDPNWFQCQEIGIKNSEKKAEKKELKFAFDEDFLVFTLLTVRFYNASKTK